MSMTPEQARWFAETFDKLVQSVGQAVLGKNEIVRLVLTAMMAPGHVLLEDAPGTGKTSLARSIAATVQGTSTRSQFTPDGRGDGAGQGGLAGAGEIGRAHV